MTLLSNYSATMLQANTRSIPERRAYRKIKLGRPTFPDLVQKLS